MKSDDKGGKKKEKPKKKGGGEQIIQGNIHILNHGKIRCRWVENPRGDFRPFPEAGFYSLRFERGYCINFWQVF